MVSVVAGESNRVKQFVMGWEAVGFSHKFC